MLPAGAGASEVDMPKHEMDTSAQRRSGSLAENRTEHRDGAFGEGGMPSRGFLLRLAGWGLTTAEILYRMPDHPKLLQTFVWQEYDLSPHFPALRRFLAFWQEKLEGPLFSVRVGHAHLLQPVEIRNVRREFRLH